MSDLLSRNYNLLSQYNDIQVSRTSRRMSIIFIILNYYLEDLEKNN